jgi:pimeloyl-ACP methyl ester carboxylesterase
MTTGVGPDPFGVHLPVALARQQGAGVLAPAYLGTWTRSRFPGADVDLAAEEVRSLIERLRSIHPQAEISVVAASAGSLVALRVLTRIAVPTVLVSPSPTSLQDLIADPRDTDVPSEARHQIVRFYRYRPGTQHLEAASASAEVEVAAFAGNHYASSLADFIADLPPRRPRCLAIVYGREDRRVRVSRLSEVRAHYPTIPVVPVAGMGHAQANERQADELARIVLETMPRQCS